MTLIAYIDGACQGNPGESGYGIVFQDEDGNELSCHAGYIGQATNNIAEYMGLLGSLERVEKYKPNTVKIFSDSQLMVNQVNGFYKVKNNTLKHLHSQVLDAIKNQKCHVEISYIPREKNKKADKLAQRAIRLRSDIEDNVIHPQR